MQKYFHCKQLKYLLYILCIIIFVVNVFVPVPLYAKASEENKLTSKGSIEGTLLLYTLEDNSTSNINTKPIYEYPISLFKQEDTTIPIQTTITDEFGNYAFNNLPTGNYKVGIQKGLVNGIYYTISDITLTEDDNKPLIIRSEENATIAFSNTMSIQNFEQFKGVNGALKIDPSEPINTNENKTASSSIQGTVWLDENQTGTMEQSSNIIPNYMVSLYKAGDTTQSVATCFTNENGNYIFPELEAGNYIVGIPKTQTIGDVSYSASLIGMQPDNAFTLDSKEDSEENNAFTSSILLNENEHLQNYNAAVHALANISNLSTPYGTDGIIVYNYSEFISALQNSSYSTIYLGANITMTANFTNVVARSTELVINGTNPTESSGTIYTYKDYNSTYEGSCLSGNCTNITFKDITIYIQNYYGVYRNPDSSQSFSLNFDGVTGEGSQFFYGGATNVKKTIFNIKDSDLKLKYVSNLSGELAESATAINFYGTVNVEKDALSEAMFYVIGTITIAENANVTWNLIKTASDRAMFYDPTVIIVEKNATLLALSNQGFCYATLTSILLDEGSSAKFIYTGSGKTEYYLKITKVTLQEDSSLLVYVNNDNAALLANTIILNIPKEFIILNPSKNALYPTGISLSATGIKSVGYLYNNSIAPVYDNSTHEYIGTEANYNKWWIQNTPFNVNSNSWTDTGTTPTTNYQAANIPSYFLAYDNKPETTLTGQNFGLSKSGQEAYGIVIKNLNVYANLSLSDTIKGEYADMNKEFTYTMYFENNFNEPIASGTTFDYTGSILDNSGASAPANGTITIDSEGKASISLKNGQMITFTKINIGSVRIVQSTSSNYTTSYISNANSGTPIVSNDTGIYKIEQNLYSFDFTNTRNMVVPTGIYSSENNIFSFAIFAILLLTGSVGIVFMRKYYITSKRKDDIKNDGE